MQKPQLPWTLLAGQLRPHGSPRHTLQAPGPETMRQKHGKHVWMLSTWGALGSPAQASSMDFPRRNLQTLGVAPRLLASLHLMDDVPFTCAPP